ncbi:MAG: GNAT family N-acetyltransferase, partial [Saprospiraceae bacterium]|nr:GNAT family N-acetyltransferase [Saprospiraceae bacterium]
MKCDIHIAQASINNLDEIVEIAIQAYKDHYTHLWDDNGVSYLETYFNYKSFKAYMLPSSLKRLYKIKVDQALVGFLTLGFGYNESGDSDPHKMELERIYFIKEATGKGIGTEVVSFIEDIARSEGHQYIWLKAMKKSPAV